MKAPRPVAYPNPAQRGISKLRGHQHDTEPSGDGDRPREAPADDPQSSQQGMLRSLTGSRPQHQSGV